jgi:dipeptidyl aminopeptidase/acylaminoacyl peptidase
MLCFGVLSEESIAQNTLQKRPIAVEDLFRLKRVSEAQISPDGKYIAVVVGEVLKAENRVNTDIWLVALSGGEPVKIVATSRSDNHPRWSSDGKLLSYISTESGTPQVYVLEMKDGKPTSAPRQVTTLHTGATRQQFSPDGTMIAFVSSVYPEFSDKPFVEANRLNKETMDALDNSAVKARVFDRLLYRHWDSWTDGTRQHLFVQSLSGGEPKNCTPGDREAVPSSDTFSSGDDYAWSPDSKELAYTASPLPQREEAWSTNHDVFTVNLQTGVRKQITTNPGADGAPCYSPDGKFIAYRFQATPGFEADKWQIGIYDRAKGSTTSLTSAWDYSVGQIEWSRDGKYILAEAEENAETLLWAVPADGSAKGHSKNIKKLVTSGTNTGFSIAQNGTIAFTQALLTRPAEVFTIALSTALSAVPNAGAKGEPPAPTQRTAFNQMMLNELQLSQPEKIFFQGAATTVQAWLVRPPNFDAKKRYPVVVLIHGGPQSAWGNTWSTRWNMQVWAAQGYVVVAPNPTGSTGFGQAFTNGVSKDWGGKPFVDIMKCVDYVVATYPFVDSSQMAAAGASYGGYMVNWIATQTTRFKTLVTHCGVFNFTSMYLTTDEVWFDEWEHGKPWDAGFAEMEKHSPHKFVQNIQTPMLVIHDGNDFRVPLQEGMQLFTALQRRGIPSKFLYIPNEGHWVLKPQNSEFWHTTIFAWLKEYLGN